MASIKDKLVSAALPALADRWLNDQLDGRAEEVGEFQAIRLDSEARQLDIRFAAKGEAEPIDLTIHNYSLQKHEDGQTHFHFERIETNRPWLNNLLSILPLPTSFALPESAAGLVKALV